MNARRLSTVLLLVCFCGPLACQKRGAPPRVTPKDPSPLHWMARHIDVFNHELMSGEEFDLRYGLAIALVREAEWEAALAHLQLLREARPNFWIVQLEYATASYMLNGPGEEVEFSLRHALELNPENPRAMIMLARVSEDTGRLDEAEGFYREAARYRGSDPDVRLGLARVLRKLERYDEAVELFGSLVRESPGDVRMRMELAASQEAAGMIDAATANFRLIAERHIDPVQGHKLLWFFLKRNEMKAEARRVERRLEVLKRDRDGAQKEMRPLLPSRR